MSAEEKQAIMAFVEGGGCFIADVRPGYRDGHCKLIDDSAWQQFLGVRFGKSERSKVLDAEIEGEVAGRPVKARLGSISLDPDVAIDGGRELGRAGETPVAVVSARGRGTAVLLNFRFGTYHHQPLEQTSGLRALLRALAASSGARPLVSVSAVPSPIFDGEVITYTDGAARYLAVLRDESEQRPTQELTVSLPTGYHVYDSRAGQYLGRTMSVQTVMTEGTTKVYALMPYVVEGVTVSCAPDVRAGEEAAVEALVVCRDGKPGRHVLRLDVVGPDGKERKHYGRNLKATNGRGICRIRLALNDTVGKWRLVARDVATGRSGTSTFNVKETQ